MSKKKLRRNVIKAIVHVHASFNNTIVTFTDVSGETLCWDSAGTVGFKGDLFILTKQAGEGEELDGLRPKAGMVAVPYLKAHAP